jgi:cation:H+ antiporter
VSTELAIAAFVAALAATLGASEVLVWGLGRLGLRLGLAAGLLGLLTALGADAPEIASATSAAFTGARDIGVGVVLGSNLFILAALLGLPPLLAGRLPFARLVPVVDGTANLLVLGVAAGLLAGVLPTPVALTLFAIVLAAYTTLLALPRRRLRRLGLAALSAQLHPEDVVTDAMRTGGGWLPVWLLVPALAVIVAGSVVMVTTAILLGRRWQVPDLVVGAVALAIITGLPNLYAAIRLGLRGDGATVVSEAFNSNTLNLVAGLGIPLAVLGAAPLASGTARTLAWVAVTTAGAIALTAAQRGLTRAGGAAVIAAYGAFLVALFRGAI